MSTHMMPFLETPSSFFTLFTFFVLACVVGYYVIWRVTPALHAPLMAVTNAISSVIVVGALLAAWAPGAPLAQGLGLAATALTMVNIVGGFWVTRRMLAMFKGAPATPLSGRQRFLSILRSLVIGFLSAALFASGTIPDQRLYLATCITLLFVMALHFLSSPRTAQAGVGVAMFGIGGTFFAGIWGFGLDPSMTNLLLTLGALIIGGGIGAVIAKRLPMTALPQLVAGFHSLVGLAATLIAGAALAAPEAFHLLKDGIIPHASRFEMGLGAIVGAITFTGSCIAFGKLQGLLKGAPLAFSGRHVVNSALAVLTLVLFAFFITEPCPIVFTSMVILAMVLGALLIWGVGGADMPVIVSMLNSYSGWAACGIGFTLNSPLLVMTGALVGASGAILSTIMCRGMNRSLVSVVLGGFGGDTDTGAAAQSADGKSVKQGNAEDAAFLMENARSVIIVPGYGMAVAGAQHALREMVDVLKQKGVKVRFAIHPVAGRMPGHMNVLLAEANIPYDDVLELDDINRDFAQTDVAFVIGANDVTNPAAKTDPSSPLYGMPILDVIEAKTVLFVKRSMAPGYSGVDNTLFYGDNTMMLFGDAKKVVEHIIRAMN